MPPPATDQAATPPSYPPKTPPPPKKPPSPPRPDPNGQGVHDLAGTPVPVQGGPSGPGGTLMPGARHRATMRNRRGRNWVYESNRWAPAKAQAAAAAQLATWGHRMSETVGDAVEAVTLLLVEAAVADGGARVSVHLSDQDGQACILALSHHPGLGDGRDDVVEGALHRITAHRPVTGCGTDAGPDGRRLWAVIDL